MTILTSILRWRRPVSKPLAENEVWTATQWTLSTGGRNSEVGYTPSPEAIAFGTAAFERTHAHWAEAVSHRPGMASYLTSLTRGHEGSDRGFHPYRTKPEFRSDRRSDGPAGP